MGEGTDLDKSFATARETAKSYNLGKQSPRAHLFPKETLGRVRGPIGASQPLTEAEMQQIITTGYGVEEKRFGMVDEVAEERAKDYDDAHILTNQVLKLAGDRLEKIRDAKMLYYWVMILSKLCRALVSPHKVDHWVDIIGYAKMAQEVAENVPSK